MVDRWSSSFLDYHFDSDSLITSRRPHSVVDNMLNDDEKELFYLITGRNDTIMIVEFLTRNINS